VVWVLESFYKLGNLAIGPMIKAILATPGLEVINGTLVEKAVERYMAQNIDFIDGYIVAVMEHHKVSEIFSYDKKHLTRIKTILRKEP
jgi:predicted nucleic-acid-binding protein